MDLDIWMCPEKCLFTFTIKSNLGGAE